MIVREDDPRKARPKSASTPETIAEMQDMVLEDRRLTERDLVEALHIIGQCEPYFK